MSYILDALKKADAERERRGVPGLHAQAEVLEQGSRPGGIAGWVLGGALIAVAAAGAWWWLRAPAPEPVQAANNAPMLPAAAPPMATSIAPPVARPETPPATSPTIEAPPKIYVPVVPKSTPTPAPTPAPTTSPAPTLSPATVAAASAAVDARVPQLAELNPELRRQLPPLAVGGSVYSAVPASRMVILNGQVLREGDSVAEGLVVERIGLKGSILSLRGTRFEIKH